MQRDEDQTEAGIESWFVVVHGPVARALERLHLAQEGRPRPARIALLVVAVTWLPLLALSAIEGAAWGDRVAVPLLKDFLPWGQFLLAVPILILGEGVAGRYLARAVCELRRSEVLVGTDTPAFDRLVDRAVRGWRGRGTSVALIALTLAAIVPAFLGTREWLTGGWQSTQSGLTLAGGWYLLVSLPVMRFLALRWLWRLGVWAWLLWSISHLDLRPQPTHPDRAGGLAFLGETQAAFGGLVLAFGFQFSALLADAVLYQDADLMSYRWGVATFVVLSLVVLLLPLLVFTPRLVRAREEAELSLTGSGHRGAAYLMQILEEDETGRLPTEQISGLADFGALFENARKMSVLPVEARHVVGMLLSALLPFLPLAFLVMPARDVLETLAKLVM